MPKQGSRRPVRMRVLIVVCVAVCCFPPAAPVHGSFACSQCASKVQGACCCTESCGTAGGCQGCGYDQRGNSLRATTWYQRVWNNNVTGNVNVAYNQCITDCGL